MQNYLRLYVWCVVWQSSEEMLALLLLYFLFKSTFNCYFGFLLQCICFCFFSLKCLCFLFIFILFFVYKIKIVKCHVSKQFIRKQFRTLKKCNVMTIKLYNKTKMCCQYLLNPCALFHIICILCHIIYFKRNWRCGDPL